MSYYNFEEIVRAVADRVLIEANPQSDLSVTDSENPAFIKGKDTFKASDSSKLDGKGINHFALASNIQALEDMNLAEDLENQTNI